MTHQSDCACAARAIAVKNASVVQQYIALTLLTNVISKKHSDYPNNSVSKRADESGYITHTKGTKTFIVGDHGSVRACPKPAAYIGS